jgi:mono/diheme cytochrome c family protein
MPSNLPSSSEPRLSLAKVALAGLALALAAFAFGAQTSDKSANHDSPSPPPNPNQPQPNSGATLFQANCARCHGPDASGNTFIGRRWKIPDLHSPAVQNLSSAQRIQIITHGHNRMPAHEKKLTADEIKSLDAYIQQLAAPPAKAPQP